MSVVSFNLSNPDLRDKRLTVDSWRLITLLDKRRHMNQIQFIGASIVDDFQQRIRCLDKCIFSCYLAVASSEPAGLDEIMSHHRLCLAAGDLEVAGLDS